MPDRRSPLPPFADVPDQDDAPVVWDAVARKFVIAGAADSAAVAAGDAGPVPTTDAATDDAPDAAAPPDAPRDTRRFYVGHDAAATAAAAGVAAPPRPAAPGAPAPSPASVPANRRPQPLPGSRPPGQPPSPGVPAPPAVPAEARPLRRRARRKWIVLLAIVLPVVLLAAGVLWARHTWDRVQKVPVGSLLDPVGAGTNYLIVGSDSREGIDPNSPDAGAILGAGAPAGQRSDTLLVLRVQGNESKIISIPRDLYVKIAETGATDRVNSAYNGGPGRLIQTIQSSLGIPINRYIEVDFVTFAGLVDALGGITIDFPHPAFDTHSGLNVTQSGPVKLDGEQALAYVRSRYYTEVIDGNDVRDGTADLGRITRQQAFLRTVLGKAGHSHNPFTLMKVGSAVSSGLRVDDHMSMVDALRFAWRMGKLQPVSVTLPTTPFTTSGGAAVLKLADGSDAALAQFRG